MIKIPGEFNPPRLSQWCGLYVRFVERGGHRLASLVGQCPSDRIQQYLLNVDENQLASLLGMEKTMDEDCLTAYGLLKKFDYGYQASHFQPLNPPPIATLADGRRYLLASKNESPILRAIPACKRFKPDHALGDQGNLGLRHEWRALEDSTAIDYAASVALDFLLEPTRRFVRIGLSPVATKDDMAWDCDPSDRRGEAGSTPFWCHGAKDEAELLGRLRKALAFLAFPRSRVGTPTPALQRRETDRRSGRDGVPTPERGNQIKARGSRAFAATRIAEVSATQSWQRSIAARRGSHPTRNKKASTTAHPMGTCTAEIEAYHQASAV